jgi:branched-chain amino acid transport system permease protein
MNYVIERLVDGLTLGVICAVLAVSYAISGGVRRSLILVNTAFYLGGIAIALGVFSAAAATRINPGEALIALLALICALAVSAIVAGAATEALPPGVQLSLRPQLLMISVGALFIAAGILQFAEQLRLPQYLVAAFAPRFSLFIPGVLKVQLAFVQPVVLGSGAAAIAAAIYLFGHGSFGRRQRAVAQDQRLAESLGIDAARMISIAIIAASMAAALSGWMATVVWAAADLTNALLLAICAFLGAVLGGLRSLPKAAAGGFAVGLGETFWSGYFGPEYAWLAVFAVLIFVLIFCRPLFASATAIGGA